MFIEIQNLKKSFKNKIALNNISLNIEKSSIVGVLGTNGAGKSTLLRTLCGIYKPDAGSVTLYGKPIFENPELKQKIFFISDYPYFFANSTLETMANFYSKLYPNWNKEKYNNLSSMFGIDKKAKIINMSKGMQRQVALILALSCEVDCLLLDEIFDGLDLIVRKLVKKLLIDEVANRGVTIILASHNSSELENICDYVAMIHSGGMVVEQDLDSLKLNIHKIQFAFKAVPENLFDELDVLKKEQQGTVFNLVIRGNKDKILSTLQKFNPLFIEVLPLSLEEIFINEMEKITYDFTSSKN